MRAIIAGVIIAVLHFGTAFAATGDIIYQNCTAASSCNGADSDNGWVRTVETSGCYSGSCLKLDGIWNTQQLEYGAGNTSMPVGSVDGYSEVTVSYYVKFDAAVDGIDGGNIKQFIPYVGGDNRYGVIIMPHHSGMYMSNVIGTFTIADWLRTVTTSDNADYAVDNEDGTYYSWNGYSREYFLAGSPAVPGTSWVKMTHYMKLPTTPTGTNGLLKIWINDSLMVDFSTAKMKQSGSETEFSYFTFMSSSEADEPFEHWMDELIIYEGYVPPTPQLDPIRSNPAPSSTLPYGTTQATLSLNTDTSSTCKYGTTAGVAYASLPNTFSSTGGTSHSQLLTGLTNGQDVPYYVRCDNGTAVNTTDLRIDVTVDSGVCSTEALEFCSQTECEELTPTHYWWGNECHTTPFVGGLLIQGGTGSLSQSGTGSLSQ